MVQDLEFVNSHLNFMQIKQTKQQYYFYLVPNSRSVYRLSIEENT